MYESEFTMAIIIASTALLGLTGVVIGQVMQSNLSNRAINRLKAALLPTFALGIFTVVYAINWLSSPSSVERLVAIITFTFQICLFSAAAIAFWFSARELQ